MSFGVDMAQTHTKTAAPLFLSSIVTVTLLASGMFVHAVTCDLWPPQSVVEVWCLCCLFFLSHCQSDSFLWRYLSLRASSDLCVSGSSCYTCLREPIRALVGELNNHCASVFFFFTQNAAVNALHGFFRYICLQLFLVHFLLPLSVIIVPRSVCMNIESVQ